MTTFTTSDREDAEKELYKTPIVPCGVGELSQMAVKILEADEPIPFYGWLKEDFGIQAAKAWSEVKFKEQKNINETL